MQIEAWRSFAATRVREGGADATLEGKYRAVAKARNDELDELLSALDPRHTLELDWARQFLAGVPADEFARHPHLNTLQEVIASQAKAPKVKLKELLSLVEEPLRIQDESRYRLVTVRLKGNGVELRSVTLGAEIKTDKWFFVRSGQLIVSKIDARNGAFGLIPPALDGAIVSAFFPVFKINETDVEPLFLLRLLTNPSFYAQIESFVSGATGRRTITTHDLLELEIPLIPREQQKSISDLLERNNKIVECSSTLHSNWRIDKALFFGTEIPLSEMADIGTGSTPSRSNLEYFGGDIHWVLTAEVCECDIDKTAETLTQQAIQDYHLRIYPADTILIAMYGQGATRGKAAYLRVPAAITQNCAGIVITRPDVLSRYVYYFIRSIYEEIRGQDYSGGGVPHLNLSIINNLRIPVPTMVEQEAVVAALDAKMLLHSQLLAMKQEAESQSRQILASIWES